MTSKRGMPARDEAFEGVVDGEEDVEETEVAADCLYLHGEEFATAEEIKHQLRFQTGTVHGAGKRIAGFRREPVVGELLDVESEPAEGLGSRIRETE